MITSKLPPRSGCSLEAVEPHPKKKSHKVFILKFKRHPPLKFIHLPLMFHYGRDIINLTSLTAKCKMLEKIFLNLESVQKSSIGTWCI